MAAHDLAHYAVETCLGFSRAFYGLLAGGTDIADFELPREVRPQALLPGHLPEEALQTEHIVNLLLVGLQGGLEPEQLLGQLRTILKDSGIPFPEVLDREALVEIQTRLAKLLARWDQTPNKGSLELPFPADA